MNRVIWKRIKLKIRIFQQSKIKKTRRKRLD